MSSKAFETCELAAITKETPRPYEAVDVRPNLLHECSSRHATRLHQTLHQPKHDSIRDRTGPRPEPK